MGQPKFLLSDSAIKLEFNNARYHTISASHYWTDEYKAMFINVLDELERDVLELVDYCHE